MSRRKSEKTARRLVWYETEVRFIIVLMVLFLLLLNQGFWTISNRFQREIETEISNDLEKIAGLLKQQIQEVLANDNSAEFTLEEKQRITAVLLNLSRISVDYRAAVIDRTDSLVAPFGRPRLTDPPSLKLSATEWAKIEDHSMILSWDRNAVSDPVISVVTDISRAGAVRGALRIEREVVTVALMNKVMRVLYVTRIVSIITTLILTIAYVRFIMLPFRIIRLKARDFLAQHRHGGSEHEAGDGVRFVIDTFEQTINELEEKEEQLQALYRKAQERVSEVETYNQYILQSFNYGVITIDSHGIITTYNRFAEELLELQTEELMQKPARSVFQQDHPIWSLYERCMEGQSPGMVEWRLVQSSGSAFILELTASMLRTHHGELIGVIFVITDQTKYRQMMERIREKRHLESIGEMSAGIAHELRNPLAAMSGYINLMKKYPEDHDRIATYLDELRVNINQLERIIRDFLNFARPTLPRVSSVEVAQLLKDSVTQAVTGTAGRIEALFEFTGDLVIQADVHLLNQAFDNLIRNGIEAISAGQGKIKISGGYLDQSNPGIWIEITDSGPGIPPETRDKIFEPFYTTKQSGFGLGLAIVKRIILNHNGEIQVVQSPEGWGACFRVILPTSLSVPEQQVKTERG